MATAAPVSATIKALLLSLRCARLMPMAGASTSLTAASSTTWFMVDGRGRATPPQWAGLKFFNVYGANETHKGVMQSVVSKVYPTVKAGETVDLFKSHDPRYRDGGQLRDFVYVKDCIAAVRWLLQNATVGDLFNVGSGAARSFLDLVNAVGIAVGREPNIRFIDTPAQLRDKYQYYTQAEMTKLRAAGFDHSFHSLEDGIRDYVQSL